MVITFLTGQRPELLKRTLQSIADNAPELFTHRVIAFNNSGDKPTTDVLKQFQIDEIIINHGTLPIGAAISLLASKAYDSGQKYWLSCEDDWLCVNSNWLETAIEFIKEKDVSQVRLRLESEPVLKKHMITGEEIIWNEFETYKITDKAHLTFNPSLIKTADIPQIFPCTGERNAQKNWLDKMQKVVQLKPAAFKHIGDENSLRLKTKCET